MRSKVLAIVGLLAVALISAYVISSTDWYHRDNPAESVENHFSVRWMGFAPSDYSSQYPNYCIDVNDLKDSTLKMQIALQIKNQESNGYYFLIDKYGEPSENWTIVPYQIGYVAVDATKQFVYSNASRIKPLSISEGLLTENVSLAVGAYNDASYTSLYSQDNFNVTINFIDRMAPSWLQLYSNNFDDGTTQQWLALGTPYASSVASDTTYYRSFQYSLKLTQGVGASGYSTSAFKKSFSVGSAYSEAYLIFSIRSQYWGSDQFKVIVNGTTYFRSDIQPSTNKWYQFALPLQTGKVSTIELWCIGGVGTGGPYRAYLDEVYIIAR
jgi:hypothetical protein